MASGTRIRRLARLLDQGEGALWVIDPEGLLTYLSAGCETWLGVDPESLLKRRSVAGSTISEDPLDRLAASLSPPPGLAARGTASLRVQPPSTGHRRPEVREVRYVRVGVANNAITIGVAGTFNDRRVDADLEDAVAVRQRLDAWRKHNGALATIATAGISSPARRLRRRIEVAASTRTDVGLFGPRGCGSEAIAHRIHHHSAPGEALVVVDGPLMDAELLDATMTPMLHQLNASSNARGTVLVRGLDEMPFEAQQRLVSLIDTFSARLRLLGLGGPSPKQQAESSEPSEAKDILGLDQEPPTGICNGLIEILSSMSIGCAPLADRVEDIPLMATAILDMRHAGGEGTAERLGRQALDSLVVYPWPGNLEELDAAIRHAVRTAPGSSIGVEHLPLAVRSYRAGRATGSESAILPLDVAVQRYQRRLIKQALRASDGNRAEAARRLGISRARFLRKLEESDHEETSDGP